jgi:hypothetical protein
VDDLLHPHHQCTVADLDVYSCSHGKHLSHYGAQPEHSVLSDLIMHDDPPFQHAFHHLQPRILCQSEELGLIDCSVLQI